MRRCVDSLLAQTFTDFEILLIDDGSPDRSGEICDEYAAKDPRIRVFHKENGGVSSARNLGLDNARGEWITFCDSDDSFERRALEIYMEAEAQSDADIIRGGYRTIYADGRIKYTQVIESKTLKNKNEILLFMESSCYYGFLWNSFYHRSVIKCLRFVEGISWCEDHLFSVQAYRNSNAVDFIPDIVYNYYKQSSGSLSYPSDPYMIIDVANLEYEAKQKLILKDSRAINETVKLYQNKIGKAMDIAINNLPYNELYAYYIYTKNKVIIFEDKQKSRLINFFYLSILPFKLKIHTIKTFYKINKLQ